MPFRSARIVASLAVCVGLLAAVDEVPLEHKYSYDDLAAGRDIHEGVYGGTTSGEFDEWRLNLGLAPGVDVIQVKNKLNGVPSPGPSFVESDKVINSPALATNAQIQWVLGDFDRADRGWFYTIGLDYVLRSYTIRYANQTNSPQLDLHAIGLHLGIGHAWYLSPSLRYELEPFVGGGAFITELDAVSTQTGNAKVSTTLGSVAEAGVRQSIVWHPGDTQTWHVGASFDYRTGYAQTTFHDKGPIGNYDTEVRLWWWGIGTSIFYGCRF
jgi:hypothetical protein